MSDDGVWAETGANWRDWHLHGQRKQPQDHNEHNEVQKLERELQLERKRRIEVENALNWSGYAVGNRSAASPEATQAYAYRRGKSFALRKQEEGKWYRSPSPPDMPQLPSNSPQASPPSALCYEQHVHAEQSNSAREKTSVRAERQPEKEHAPQPANDVAALLDKLESMRSELLELKQKEMSEKSPSRPPALKQEKSTPPPPPPQTQAQELPVHRHHFQQQPQHHPQQQHPQHPQPILSPRVNGYNPAPSERVIAKESGWERLLDEGWEGYRYVEDPDEKRRKAMAERERQRDEGNQNRERERVVEREREREKERVVEREKERDREKNREGDRDKDRSRHHSHSRRSTSRGSSSHLSPRSLSRSRSKPASSNYYKLAPRSFPEGNSAFDAMQAHSPTPHGSPSVKVSSPKSPSRSPRRSSPRSRRSLSRSA